MLRGPSGLPGKYLQLGLSCVGETPLGKEPAGLGREDSRKGLGKQRGRRGDKWLVCMEVEGSNTCQLGLGSEDVAKSWEWGRNPISQHCPGLQKSNCKGHKLLMQGGGGTVPCEPDPARGAAEEPCMGSSWPLNDKEELGCSLL